MNRCERPRPGDRVLFKWRGAWVRGIVTGDGTALRVPVQRDDGPGKRRIHWRNRTQLFEPEGDDHAVRSTTT